MKFDTAEPKFKTHRVVRLTEENIAEAAAELNGTLEDGILTFQVSNHVLRGIVGDWLVVFGTDVHIYTDKYYQRNYNAV